MQIGYHRILRSCGTLSAFGFCGTLSAFGCTWRRILRPPYGGRRAVALDLVEEARDREGEKEIEREGKRERARARERGRE